MSIIGVKTRSVPYGGQSGSYSRISNRKGGGSARIREKGRYEKWKRSRIEEKINSRD